MPVLTNVEESFKKVTYLFNISGMVLDNSNLSLRKIRKYQFIFLYSCLTVYLEWVGCICWFLNGIRTGQDFTSLTYVAPCFTITLVCVLKSWFYVLNNTKALKIMETFKSFEMRYNSNNDDKDKSELIKKDLKYLHFVIKILDFVNWLMIISFSLMPLVPMVQTYMEKGVWDRILPLLVEFPFDPFEPRVWPFVYCHQIHSIILVAVKIAAVDFFLYICCTYIHVNFKLIQHDIESLIPNNDKKLYKYDLEFKNKIEVLVIWHKRLLICAQDLEKIFSIPTLANFVTSSFLICLSGFNITTIEDKAFVLTFVCFLWKNLMQIYFLCYFGDLLRTSSINLSDAVYNSHWYLADYKIGRSLFIMLIRAQKPCKLTAWCFADVTIAAFSKILSTSYSYFTILRTAYTGEK